MIQLKERPKEAETEESVTDRYIVKRDEHYFGDDGYSTAFHYLERLADNNMDVYGHQITMFQNRKIEVKKKFTRSIWLVATNFIIPAILVGLLYLLTWLGMKSGGWAFVYSFFLIAMIPYLGINFLFLLPINLKHMLANKYIAGMQLDWSSYSIRKKMHKVHSINDCIRDCGNEINKYRAYIDDLKNREDETNPELSVFNHNNMTEKQEKVLDDMRRFAAQKNIEVTDLSYKLEYSQFLLTILVGCVIASPVVILAFALL